MTVIQWVSEPLSEAIILQLVHKKIYDRNSMGIRTLPGTIILQLVRILNNLINRQSDAIPVESIRKK